MHEIKKRVKRGCRRILFIASVWTCCLCSTIAHGQVTVPMKRVILPDVAPVEIKSYATLEIPAQGQRQRQRQTP